MASRGAGSFPGAPIHLDASLVHTVGMSASTPLFRFRVVNAFVAAGASMMCFLLLCRWTDNLVSFVMASGWSLASNLSVFVAAGFRNPIPAATMVYLAGLWFLSSRSRLAPFWAGLLIPLAVFLREPFPPIVLVSLYFAATLHGRISISCSPSSSSPSPAPPLTQLSQEPHQREESIGVSGITELPGVVWPGLTADGTGWWSGGGPRSAGPEAGPKGTGGLEAPTAG